MSKRVRIISDSISPSSVRVLDANGDPIKWGRTSLVAIEIRKLEPHKLIEAVFTIRGLDLDLEALAAFRDEKDAP